MDQDCADAPVIKTEPGSPAGHYDDKESLFFDAKIKTDDSSYSPVIKKEIVYPELSIDFEPPTDVNDCPETKVKVEKHEPTEDYLFNPDIPSVKLEPGTSTETDEQGAGNKVLQYSWNTDQHIEGSSQKQNSGPDATVLLTTPGRSKEIISPAKENSRSHVVTETGKKQFSCSQCAYVCHKEGLLKRHNLTHIRGKLYSCSECSYTSNHKGDLRSHTLIHTGEKPFSCSQCTYSCNRKSRLRSHMLTHTGEKPFSCPQCSYTCAQRCHLRIHMLTHTGEKPFSCSQCPYTCRQISHLRRHMYTHTGEKSFSCSFCSYICCAKDSLKRHMITHIGKKC